MSIDGWDANSLYLYCSGQEMSCCKEPYIEVSNPRTIKDLCDEVMMGKLLGFLQVDIHIPNGLLEKFSEFSPLFIIDDITKNDLILNSTPENRL